MWGGRVLMEEKTLIIDDIELQGFPEMEKEIEKRIERLFCEGHSTIIHGDFHFGNILYDINARLVKLIDPRGNFGRSGIFGDCKYDFAKLRHSINGGYNYIVNDLFHVDLLEGNRIEFTLPQNPNKETLLEFLDGKISEEGFDLEDIKLIEGLLFLSMTPLHSGHPYRQLAMFARSIQLLNKVV